MLDRISLSGIPLFARLSETQQARVWRLIRIATYKLGETVLEEGSPPSDSLYIILDGEAALCKRGRNPLTNGPLEYELEVQGKNEIFGWVSVLDGRPFPLTVIARAPLTLAILDLSPRIKGARERHLRNILIAELRRYLASFVRSSLEDRVSSLQHEAEFARYRNAVGSIVITALALLSFYTLALSLLPRFQTDLEANFLLSPIIIVFFAAFFFPVIKRSGFPAAFFGFCLDNWRAALPFAAAASLVFLAIVAFLKWLLIATVPQLHGLSLIAFPDIQIGNQNDTNTPWYWVALSLYLLLTPVQEFVARCGIQAPLYAFLQGSELKRAGLSILVSNLVFSAVHAHIGLAFALIAFVPGLFWGWLFLRTNSWLAASASHLLVGGASIFLFGAEEFIRRLT
jgi:CRP-like cAMP-binding protein/membrane protease YdiL (CAAX protease family)